MLLTQEMGNIPLISQIMYAVRVVLGYLMNGIFFILDKLGIPYTGVAIILFTIVIYIFLTPLTYKQQKFSKLQSKMSPELQKIQAKYKGKKDNDSVMAMNAETQAVYAKYGVSASGSCLQLLIQIPVIWSLYRVINNMPAYVGKIKEAFSPLVDQLILKEGSKELISNFTNAAQHVRQFENAKYLAGDTEYIRNTYIDILNQASTADWQTISTTYPDLASAVDNSQALLSHYNSFFGLNMGNSPLFQIKEAFANHAYLIVFAAIMIPVLAAFTQWFNTKLMPQQQSSGNEQADQMMQSMKMMNVTMPLVSAWFTLSLPSGVGLYWIIGAVVRSVQQVVINKRIDKMDFDAIIEANKEKAAKKMEKQGLTNAKLKELANVKNGGSQKSLSVDVSISTDKEEKIRKATEYYQKNAKEGSIAAKANMVKLYNEKNTK